MTVARRIPIGYEVRRPLTLWGRKRTIGEYIPASEVASMPRIESMVRAGRFIEVFDDPAVKALHGRHQTRPEPVIEVVATVPAKTSAKKIPSQKRVRKPPASPKRPLKQSES
jgi:hypothetical protein